MWIETLSYLVTFIVSAGMSAIGILVSYQLYQQNKASLFATLMYYQIFLFSFLSYSVWGNMALRVILNDISFSETISEKLALFVPIIGIPFMLVSWFMLIRFAFNLNGYKFTKAFIYGYFPTLVVMVFTLAWLIHKQILNVPSNADLFIVRILVGLNLVAHLFFILPFLKPKTSSKKSSKLGFDKNMALLFLAAVIVYSAALSFITTLGFISVCLSIILLFSSGAIIPIIIRFRQQPIADDQSFDFAAFCKHYEISKREAEIIKEICSGKTNKAIAEKLYITLQTVKDHNHRIFTKTGVRSRVQLSNLVREKTS